MYIRRDIEAKLITYLESKEEHSNVLLVQGARQVGKTAICKRTLSLVQDHRRCTSINLEERPDFKLQVDQCQNFLEFTMLLKNTLGFEPGQDAILFIDEAQESKTLGSFVRFMKENWSHTKCILTGSSMSKFFADETRIPVGRYESLFVRPCSFREFLRSKDLESTYDGYLRRSTAASPVIHEQLLKLFDEYTQVGGLPAAVVANQEHKDYRATHALVFASQRDDFYRKEKLKDHLFSDAMQAVARQLANPSNLKQVAPTYRDATQIIEALKRWSLVHEIEQTGSLPTQNFHGKWYLYDLGILSFLRLNALSTLSLLDTKNEVFRTPLGAIVENAVLLQLQAKEHSVGHLAITGWKKNNKQSIEVDFVVKILSNRQEQLIPIEVKASHHVNSHDVANLKHFLDFSGARAGIVVALEPPRQMKGENWEIDIVPIYCDFI
jgi:uncharacterized protein